MDEQDPELKRIGSPSKRWTTTASAANQDFVRRMAEESLSAPSKESLRAVKLAQTRGSISFGHEKVNYISDCHDRQQNALLGQSTESRKLQQQHIKEMKANLTTTNFCLGDEKVDYESTNREAMKNITKHDLSGARPGLNKELKEQIKKSSLHFGNEPVNYKSVASEGYINRGVESPAAFDQRRHEIKEMTARLRKHNFSMGDEPVDYTSDYTSGFGSVPIGSYNKKDEKAKLKTQIEDIRKCHFTLGHDKVEYESDAHRAGRTIEGHAAADVKKSADNAKLMKAALQRTSIVIGNDEEYM